MRHFCETCGKEVPLLNLNRWVYKLPRPRLQLQGKTYYVFCSYKCQIEFEKKQKENNIER